MKTLSTRVSKETMKEILHDMAHPRKATKRLARLLRDIESNNKEKRRRSF